SAETKLETGDGADVVNVSSDAPTNGGTLNLLAGHLTVDGQGGSDTLNISDLGDTTDNTGDLTFDELTGLGSAGIHYLALEFLNIDLRSGNDTFTVHGTHANETTLDTGLGSDNVYIQTIAGHTMINTGAGSDTVRVGSTAPGALGLVDDIDAQLELQGADDGDFLFVDDTGDTTNNTGRLTLNRLTGLGMGG